MKIKTAMAVVLLSGTLVSPAIAQDRERGQDQPSSTFRAEQRAPRVPQANLPTSTILPMRNPIAPMMTAPVQPFVRYQGPQGTPTVVVPPTRTEERDRDRDDRDRDRRRGRDDRDIIVVGGGVYLPPYYDSVIYQPPYLTPAPVPGQLPGTYPATLPASSYVPPAETVRESASQVSTAGVAASPASAVRPTVPQETIFYPDSNVIITPEPPVLTVERPALGISRTDAIARYGEPWGSITMRGRETLYFRGALVVVFENDRAVEIR